MQYITYFISSTCFVRHFRSQSPSSVGLKTIGTEESSGRSKKMNQFIYTWDIKNISYSWHQMKDGIFSPLFVAESLRNTVWHLSFYPKGYHSPEWNSFYLHKNKDRSLKDFSFNYELSCVSGNNLTLTSYVVEGEKVAEGRKKVVGKAKFLQIHEVFVQRKDLYLHQDTLTLRCRIWRKTGIRDLFAQSFGSTRLEIERISSVEDISPRTNYKKTFFIHSNRKNNLLISFDVSIEKDALQVETQPFKTEQMKLSVFEFSVTGKNRKTYKFNSSWMDKPCKQLWKSKIEGEIRKTLMVTYEFSYSTGEITNTIEIGRPASFKYPEFSINCILSCIPSGKLYDCPSICEDLWDMYLKQIFCDVELKTETSSFRVHKVVLCARSPVFLAMFANPMNESTEKCVKIEDLGDDTMETLIKFLYTDTFEETKWGAVLDLYYAADKYQVSLLKAYCVSYFKSTINEFQVFELLMLADKHNDSDLKLQVEDYISKNRLIIFALPQWEQFSEKQPLWASRIMMRKYKTKVKRNITVRYPGAIDDFRSLYEKATVGDAVVQTTDASFPVQKMMICAGSPKLMEMLSSGQSSDSLKIEDLDYDTVSNLIRFLQTDYLGNINIKTAIKLYKAAFIYQIERLKIKCSCFFISKLDVSNASSLLQLAYEHQDVKLQSLVEDILSLRDLKISVPKSWLKRGKTESPKRMETRRSKRIRLEKDT